MRRGARCGTERLRSGDHESRPTRRRLVAVVREGNTLPMPRLSDAGIVVVLPDDVLQSVYA